MSGRAPILRALRTASKQVSRPKPAPRCLNSLQKRHFTHENSRSLNIFPKPHLRRHASSTARNNGTIMGGARKLFRDSPVQFSLAIAIIIGAFGFLLYTMDFYRRYIIGAYHNYPESVAKELRKAIYYMQTELQPNDALKYFKRALQACEEERMDPMSDEVMGIRIEVSRLMEIVHRYDKAIEVLERVRDDNMRWMEAVGGGAGNKIKRTRVLTRTVAVHVKLAELYSNATIWQRDLAEERLVWAVETVYSERQRRRTQNISDEDEGPWMSDDEIGATDEQLAQTYAEKDQHYLAVPLYLQCLQLKATTDCHTVTLMSNLASSLAQQSPRMAREVQAFAQSRNVDNQPQVAGPSGPVAAQEKMIEDAKQWAQKALEVAATMKSPTRTEECDVGCVVATHNLGELAEMLGNKLEARKRYEEAVALARRVGFAEGVENSTARLKHLA